jgi:hypothetical protein
LAGAGAGGVLRGRPRGRLAGGGAGRGRRSVRARGLARAPALLRGGAVLLEPHGGGGRSRGVGDGNDRRGGRCGAGGLGRGLGRAAAPFRDAADRVRGRGRGRGLGLVLRACGKGGGGWGELRASGGRAGDGGRRARRRSRSRANRRATVGRARVPLGLPRGRFGVPSAPRFRAMAIGTSSSSARLPGAVRTGRPAMRPAPRRLWAEGIASEVAGSSAGRFQSSTGRDSQAGGPKGRSSPVGTAGAMALCLEPMPHVPPRRSGRWSLGARASGAPRSSVGRFPPSPQVTLGFPPRQTSSAFARARRSNRRENY